MPSIVEIVFGDSKVLEIENIGSSSPCVSLNIQVRQKTGSELTWVSLQQGSPSEVLIATPADLVPGDYTLVLESYDQNSPGKLTIYEDTITFTVAAPNIQSDEAPEISLIEQDVCTIQHLSFAPQSLALHY